jgi:hypothetical protein
MLIDMFTNNIKNNILNFSQDDLMFKAKIYEDVTNPFTNKVVKGKLLHIQTIGVPEHLRGNGICTSLMRWIEENLNVDEIRVGPVLDEAMEHILIKLSYKPIPPFCARKQLTKVSLPYVVLDVID